MNLAKIWRGVKRVSPIILSSLAAVGTVTTPILAVNGKDKADAINESIPDNARPIDICKALIPAYGPAVASGFFTLACITCSTAISWARIKNISNAAAGTEKLFAKYREAVAATVGAAGTEAVDRYLAEHPINDIPESDNRRDGKCLFYDSFYNYYFWASKSDIIWATRVAYSTLKVTGEFYVCDFYQEIGVKPPEASFDQGWFFSSMDDIWPLESEADLVDFSEDTVGEYNGNKYRTILWFEAPKYH